MTNPRFPVTKKRKAITSSFVIGGAFVIPWSLVGHWWGIRHCDDSADQHRQLAQPIVGKQGA
jgi:hypothetical protein